MDRDHTRFWTNANEGDDLSIEWWIGKILFVFGAVDGFGDKCTWAFVYDTVAGGMGRSTESYIINRADVLKIKYCLKNTRLLSQMAFKLFELNRS